MAIGARRSARYRIAVHLRARDPGKTRQPSSVSYRLNLFVGGVACVFARGNVTRKTTPHTGLVLGNYLTKVGVCTENSSSGVVVMKSARDAK